MLYRIEVNVIAMPFEIDLVTQGVLPVASLLDATFAFGVATWRTRLTTRNTSGELSLDQPPTRGEIRVTRRQSPDRMEVIRQYYDGLDSKRVAGSDIAKRDSK